MEGIYAAVLTFALFCVTSVRCVCDESTSGKIQQCIFTSDLYNPATVPQTEAGVKAFCENKVNDITDCMQTHLDECVGNAKQQKLLDLLVDLDATREGLNYMCSNLNVLTNKASCLASFGDKTFSDCLQSSMGALQNMGDMTEPKEIFDTVCRFFDSFKGCFTSPFEGDCSAVGDIYSKLFEGIKYPYCKLNAFEREAALRDYQYGTAGSSYATLSTSLFVALCALYKLIL